MYSLTKLLMTWTILITAFASLFFSPPCGRLRYGPKGIVDHYFRNELIRSPLSNGRALFVELNHDDEKMIIVHDGYDQYLFFNASQIEDFSKDAAHPPDLCNNMTDICM